MTSKLTAEKARNYRGVNKTLTTQGKFMSQKVKIFADVENKTLKMGDQIFKPGDPIKVSGILGYWEVRQTPKAGFHIVRLSSGGNFRYACNFPGGTGEYILGPDYGSRVKDPKEETDPLKKILIELGVNPKTLERFIDGESLHIWVVSSCLENLSCPTWDNKEWKTSGGVFGEWEYSDLYGDQVATRSNTLSEAKWAFEITTRKYSGGKITRYVSRVVVWPSCTEADLRVALASW